MQNRLDKVFQGSKPLTSVYFTAGYPDLDSTVPLLELIQSEGVDFVEIGFPFSDPVADGSVIQQSSERALKNGMTLKKLFEQLKGIRSKISLPLILMGYLNPVEQFGYDNFLQACKDCEIDALILPDLPLELYVKSFKKKFEQAGLHGILLVTPSSSDERIRLIDQASSSFIYAVSSAAVTGGAVSLDENRLRYFERLKQLKLRSPLTVGFGIDGREALSGVHRFARAGIIGSAFLKSMRGNDSYLDSARAYLRNLELKA